MQTKPFLLASLLLVSLALPLPSCGGSKAQGEHTETTEESRRAPQPFDADSAYSYIASQVAFGPRVPGSVAHTSCASWIEAKLKSWGYVVTLQTFKNKDYFGKEVQGTNIIATRHPEGTGERILLMAHWDTRPVADHDPDTSAQGKAILGADDGASGVGVLLEIARQESLTPSDKAIDFVFFDLEDGGHSQSDETWCLGSTHWATHPHTPSYKARYGILLDMVGAQGARFYWETLSKDVARPTLSTLWGVASQLGWGSYFVQADGGAMTDDHVPVVRHLGIPVVDIINFDPNRPTGFGAHWHTMGDNMNVILKETLQAVGETVRTALHEEL